MGLVSTKALHFPTIKLFTSLQPPICPPLNTSTHTCLQIHLESQTHWLVEGTWFFTGQISVSMLVCCLQTSSKPSDSPKTLKERNKHISEVPRKPWPCSKPTVTQPVCFVFVANYRSHSFSAPLFPPNRRIPSPSSPTSWHFSRPRRRWTTCCRASRRREPPKEKTPSLSVCGVSSAWQAMVVEAACGVFVRRGLRLVVGGDGANRCTSVNDHEVCWLIMLFKPLIP